HLQPLLLALPSFPTRRSSDLLLAIHVGFNGFPHPHDFAVRLYPSQGALYHLVVFIPHHFVEQLRVSEGSALSSQVVTPVGRIRRSEEHTSELQSRENLVCRLL